MRGGGGAPARLGDGTEPQAHSGVPQGGRGGLSSETLVTGPCAFREGGALKSGCLRAGLVPAAGRCVGILNLPRMFLMKDPVSAGASCSSLPLRGVDGL